MESGLAEASGVRLGRAPGLELPLPRGATQPSTPAYRAVQAEVHRRALCKLPSCFFKKPGTSMSFPDHSEFSPFF